jgi:kinesin family member 5
MECTGMNDRSSRSHTILVLEYKQWNLDGSVKQAKLNLVDLAGSERIGKTGAKGKILDEAKKINQSLSTLGRVIKALTENDDHVPFRDSKLTHLLRESLGGNSKTTLLCTVSRKFNHFEESVQSLTFAGRVKKIKNKAVTNIMKS